MAKPCKVAAATIQAPDPNTMPPVEITQSNPQTT